MTPSFGRILGLRGAVCLYALIGAMANAQHLQSIQRVGQLSKTGGGNLLASDVLSDPTVLYEGGKYRMWYTGVRYAYTPQQVMGITYAESTDGVVWQPLVDSGQPSLQLSPTPGGWDAGGVETASVVKTPDGTYWMFYSGDYASASDNWAIGLAKSTTGAKWTKVGSGPVLRGRGGWEGPFLDGATQVGGVCEPAVIYDPVLRLFKMWYVGFGELSGVRGYRVGYATSTDGVNWSPMANPVLGANTGGAWDDLVISHVNVVYDPVTGYHLFYFGTSVARYADAEQVGAVMLPGGIGHAMSSDGITWVRDPAPVVNVVPGTWESWMVGGPTALITGDQLKLWYFGSASSASYQFRMGLVAAVVR